MSGMSASGGTGQVPYFFLSYARMPMDETTSGDPNRWVYRLFDDLCEELVQMTTLRKKSEAGFLDRKMRLGEQWPDEVSRALATCRVFVPLYSPRYFNSEQCGREWSAIQMRLRAHTSEPPPVIIPIMWIPIEPNSMPDCARLIQFSQEGFWPDYLRHGLYSVAKVSSQRNKFLQATLTLARRISQVAELSPLQEAQDLPRYTTLPNAFDGYRAEQRMKVSVVAPHLGNLPNGRNPYYYGMRPHEWNPYRDEGNHQPLAHQVTEFARRRGIGAEIGPLSIPEDDQGSPDQPGMMLVDPWATDMPDTYEALRQFGGEMTRWFPVVVPWNSRDKETSDAEPRLRRLLGEAIPGGQGQPAVHEIKSLDDLQREMPRMLERAFNRYLRTAQVYPPPGGSGKKPRLMEPGDGDDERRD
ncbi:TIR-like protein FxsC [Nonomuraea sp. NPDC049784]|uniref:TIR-like protein FxsC n=1 Tax=Nonomuraea sp. NPDC049784 TaxID=3154361 RepID=UPI0033F1917D